MSTRVLEIARQNLDAAKEASMFDAKDKLVLFAENLLAIITSQQYEIDQLKRGNHDKT